MKGRDQTHRRPTARRERALATLAERQHGVVSLRQLIAIGFSRDAIDLRLDRWHLRLVHREVYAVGHAKLGRHGRWMAAVLAYGDRSLLSHRSAAELWGFARQPAGIVDVTAPQGRQGVGRRAGVFIHRGKLDPEDRTELSGIPVTTAARTLFDLAESVRLKQLESAWEEADRLSLLELTAVERVCDRGRGRRALKSIRLLLSQGRAAAESTHSPLESDFSHFCHEHRLPPPIFNALVIGFEVDALWPAQHVIVELDGFAFHHHRAAFERDRARDSALQVAGYRTLHVTHRRLHGEPAIVATQIRTMLGVSELDRP
jgi:predicted transcriptional regulator of viral defense system